MEDSFFFCDFLKLETGPVGRRKRRFGMGGSSGNISTLHHSRLDDDGSGLMGYSSICQHTHSSERTHHFFFLVLLLNSLPASSLREPQNTLITFHRFSTLHKSHKNGTNRPEFQFSSHTPPPRLKICFPNRPQKHSRILYQEGPTPLSLNPDNPGNCIEIRAAVENRAIFHT